MQTSHIRYLIYFSSKPPEMLRWGYRLQLQIASQDLSEITWLFRRTHHQKKVPPAPESRAEDFKSKAQEGVRPPERRLRFGTVVPGMQISPLPQVTGLFPSGASTWGRDVHLQVVVGTEVNLWKCPAECLVLCGSWMPWGCSFLQNHTLDFCLQVSTGTDTSAVLALTAWFLRDSQSETISPVSLSVSVSLHYQMTCTRRTQTHLNTIVQNTEFRKEKFSANKWYYSFLTNL